MSAADFARGQRVRVAGGISPSQNYPGTRAQFEGLNGFVKSAGGGVGLILVQFPNNFGLAKEEFFWPGELVAV